VPATSDQTHTQTQPAGPTDAGHADRDTPTAAPVAGPTGKAVAQPVRRRRFGPGVAGVAAALACLICLLPLLAAGGLAAGLAAAVTDVDLILVALTAAGVVAAGVWVSRRRKAKAGSCGGTGC
jgi:hypothetical protein